MSIFPKYTGKSKSSNRVHLVKTVKEIDKIKLNKSQKNVVADAVKTSGKFSQRNFTNYFAVFHFKKMKDTVEREALRTFGAQVYEQCKDEVESIQVDGTSSEAIGLFLEGFCLASYRFEKYFTNKKEVKLKAVFTTNKSVRIDDITTVIDAVSWARDLVNEPVSYLTAVQLGKEIAKKCENTGIKVDVFSKSKIESLKMGGLLAVNKGSIDPPTFTVMEYKPKNARNNKPIVFVGKGIVYDTGGLSLKPTPNSMDFMKSDMGGAACMVATTYAAAQLGLPLHIITLIPSTDNRPGGAAYAPGDVITMFNKMTVEVLNTDAEGRMVMADALSYGDKFKPELVIDAATLTGAAARAVGTFATCIMGNAKQTEMDAMIEAGYHTNDRLVQFPFWDDYKAELKSTIADITNLGGPYAGMITAGKFLEHFTKSPYIHLDIAGPAYSHKKDSYRGQGGTGAGVRMLTEYLKRKAK